MSDSDKRAFCVMLDAADEARLLELTVRLGKTRVGVLRAALRDYHARMRDVPIAARPNGSKKQLGGNGEPQSVLDHLLIQALTRRTK